jgi:hypothetical protein
MERRTMTANTNLNVERILYKEIVEGDLLKIRATSNKSQTGGGARDFRFGSYNKLLLVINKMFPTLTQESRKRGGINSQIYVFKGVFSWRDSTGGPIITKDSFFEPPTSARPSEGRIVRVHDYGCFNTAKIPKGGVGNRVLLLFIQLADGSVWPYFAEEATIRTPGCWDANVAAELIKCLDAKRGVNQVVIGYRDFTSAMSYCNGK